MPTIKVYNLNNVVTGEISLPEEIFGAEYKEYLLHDVVVWQLAKRRAGTHDTKTRSEVNYSSHKLYRQKGTGMARRGSRKSPVLKGGGVAFGPHPRSHEHSLNKKVRKAALRVALSHHVRSETLKVVEDFQLAEVKTKKLVGILGKIEVGANALIIEKADNGNLKLSARNLPKVDVLPPEGLNVYDILNHERLVMTKQALEVVQGALK